MDEVFDASPSGRLLYLTYKMIVVYTWKKKIKTRMIVRGIDVGHLSLRTSIQLVRSKIRTDQNLQWNCATSHIKMVVFTEFMA